MAKALRQPSVKLHRFYFCFSDGNFGGKVDRSVLVKPSSKTEYTDKVVYKCQTLSLSSWNVGLINSHSCGSMRFAEEAPRKKARALIAKAREKRCQKLRKEIKALAKSLADFAR